MAVYIVEIPGSEFTGVKGGVDYYKGKGSTSSLSDAREAQKRGAVVRDMAGRSIAIEAALHPEAHVEVLTVKALSAPVAPAPAIESKTEGVTAVAPSATLPDVPPVHAAKPAHARKGGRKK